METILLTGAPGFIGTFMGASFLSGGDRVIFLARPGNGETAFRRVEKSLTLVDASVLTKEFQVLDGDVTLEDCGIPIEALSGVTTIFHAAGKLDYSWAKRDETAKVNVGGTKNILKLARYMPALKRVVFISTAYVCGSRQGEFREDHKFCEKPIFDNAYELTKLKGENYVRAWSRKSKIDTFILRPSIVVGRSSDGAVIGCTGFYSFMKVINAIVDSQRIVCDHLNGENFILNVPGDEKAPLNITPVDWLVDMTNKILDRNVPGIYHVVAERPETYGFWLDVGSKYLGLPGVCVSNRQSSERSIAILERMVKRGVSSYRCFIERHPIFDVSNLKRVLGDSYVPCHADEQLVHTILKYARERNFAI